MSEGWGRERGREEGFRSNIQNGNTDSTSRKNMPGGIGVSGIFETTEGERIVTHHGPTIAARVATWEDVRRREALRTRRHRSRSSDAGRRGTTPSSSHSSDRSPWDRLP